MHMHVTLSPSLVVDSLRYWYMQQTCSCVVFVDLTMTWPILTFSFLTSTDT